MSIRWRAFSRILALLCCAAAPMLACSIGGVTGASSSASTPSATAGPPPCATHATTTALAWVAGNQVVGRIPATAAPATLSNFTFPLGIPDEGAVGNAPKLSFLAIAPDAAHIAVAVDQIVPFSTEYNPFIVNTTTHAVTRVPLSSTISVASEGSPHRLFAWADAHTLIIFTRTNAQKYDITTNTLTTLPGISNPVEGVVRCSTLFYSTDDGADSPTIQIVPEKLNRYDLGTSSPIGAAYTISDAGTWAGAEGHIEYGGWDVSPDGSHIAYQKLSLSLMADNGGLNESSHWYRANADGSGVAAILPLLTSNSMSIMSISPDGAHVAVLGANPAPATASGPLAGGATRFYDSPGASEQVAWTSNSSGFYAGTSFDPYTLGAVALFPIGAGGHATGSTVVSHAGFPASLP